MKTANPYLKITLSFILVFIIWSFCKTAQACNTSSSFQLSGCDSVVSPSGKQVWRINGQYLDTIPNSMGCDSFMVIMVNLNAVNAYITPDLGNRLKAFPENAKYLWLSCTSTDTLSMDRSFSPPGAGWYRVIVDLNGCIDTSACFYHSLGSIGSGSQKTYSMYPNPANTFFTVENDIPMLLTVRSVNGQILFRCEESNQVRIDTRNLKSGTYLLEINTSSGKWTEKLVIVHD